MGQIRGQITAPTGWRDQLGAQSAQNASTALKQTSIAAGAITESGVRTTSGVVAVQLGSTAAAIVVGEAALGFVGLGPRGGVSLGAVLDQGVAAMLRAPHVLAVGAVVLLLMVFALQCPQIIPGAGLAVGEGEGVVLDVAHERDVAVARLEQIPRSHRAARDLVDGDVRGGL